MSLKSDVDSLSLPPIETMQPRKSTSSSFITISPASMSAVESAAGKELWVASKTLSWLGMLLPSVPWENFGQHFQTCSCHSPRSVRRGDTGLKNCSLSLSPTGAKKCVHFHPIALTPAAFAWVASRALTESLLFLQSSQIDLIINRYSEQIQVFFISRKHLLSQTRECLAGKHRQRTLRSGLPELTW